MFDHNEYVIRQWELNHMEPPDDPKGRCELCEEYEPCPCGCGWGLCRDRCEIVDGDSTPCHDVFEEED